MQPLSFTQEYFLCSVNDKGDIPMLYSSYVQAGLLVGGMLELLQHGYIRRDEQDHLRTGKDWDDQLPYLRPLYNTIVGLKKPRDIKGVATQYMFKTSPKPFNEYFDAIGLSLAAAGCADELSKPGAWRDKLKYIPREAAIHQVVQRIRTELLEEGVIYEQTVCLVAFLDKSDMIKQYFSKFEAKALKARIKEIRSSEAYASIKEVLDEVDNMIAMIVIVLGMIATV